MTNREVTMKSWGNTNPREIPATEISTLLGKDAEIRGSIKTQGSVRIDGIIVGELSSTKTVTIGATGSVDGNIHAEDIIVGGKVKGTLNARGKITLDSSAQLEGDLNASRLTIAEGAVFRGRSSMGAAARATVLSPEEKLPLNVPKSAEKVAAA
jgi:cytoskeletal protein CcmA (bactofilin family)